jgi:hypothetical protein
VPGYGWFDSVTHQADQFETWFEEQRQFVDGQDGELVKQEKQTKIE